MSDDAYSLQQMPASVPFTEQLRAVPENERLRIDDDDGPRAGSSWYPVGRYCHDAAEIIEWKTNRIAALEAEVAELRREALLAKGAPQPEFVQVANEIADRQMERANRVMGAAPPSAPAVPDVAALHKLLADPSVDLLHDLASRCADMLAMIRSRVPIDRVPPKEIPGVMESPPL